MDAQRFCVYNLTRDSLLGQEVSVVDTAVEPLKKLAEYLGAQAKTGVWLLPYRGIPSVPRMPPFDLVCLDADHRVIQVVEMLSSAGYVQLEAESASALVLKARTLYSSQTRPGDQLMICFPAEMESQLERRSGKENLVPLARGVTSPAERTILSGASASPLPVEPFRQQQPVKKDGADSQDDKKDSLKARFLRWLIADRRRASRYPSPKLIAYRWTGDAPQAHRIGDISETGLYLLTQDRWSPGTMVRMTLQKANSSGEDPADSIAVQTRVVRWGSDGEGLDFVLSSLADIDGHESWHATGTSRRALKRFLQRI
ncbi:MAG: PilZ domain-containing protein [Terracidiphilus sp.]